MFPGLFQGTNYLLNQLIEFFVQLFLFFAIPLFWFQATKKKDSESFMQYVGLQKAPAISYAFAFLITGAAYIFNFLYFVLLKLGGGMQTTLLEEAYAASPPAIFVLIALFYSLTAGVCGELLFRGFIGKRLIRHLGFGLGNVLQAVIFMLPFLYGFAGAPVFEMAGGVLCAGLMGYAFGFIMHKRAQGSILPSMLLHVLVTLVEIPICLFWL